MTYNVNGLRQRVAQYGTLPKLLSTLDADIICFQETKLTRQDLSVDLTFAEGYEAFLSCTRGNSRGRSAYSGVATFCRVKSAFDSDEAALPVAAEEGFTGLLNGSKKEMMVGDFELELPLNVDDLEDVTDEELLKMDSEGRCVITDHGHFVLFNLYGPRAEEDDKERLRFKLLFFKVLQERWETLLSQGKRVIVVGDLNIAPAAIDRCDAQPGFEKNRFRKWLRSLLRDSGGPFFDVFRSKHPERREAYTCFSPMIGAEEFNYGSRIDHILIAGPCLHKEQDSEGHNFLVCHAEECDIMIQLKRGNAENTPKWQGGRTIKLDGSDHVPVYAVLSDVPNLYVHNTPPLAVRYIPEVRGWQQTIVSFLRKKENHPSIRLSCLPKILVDENVEEIDNGKCMLGPDGETISGCEMVAGASQFSFKQKLPNSVSEVQPSVSSLSDHSDMFTADENMMLAETQKGEFRHCSTSLVKKARRSTQLTLKAFFKQPRGPNYINTLSTDSSHAQADSMKDGENVAHETEPACARKLSENIDLESIVPVRTACIEDPENINSCSKMEKGNAAMLQWQKIQEKMRTSIPLCKGHHEPCVARSVKKGPNAGRRFYVCARPKGPESESEANCNYFQWASTKSKQKRN